MEKYCKPDSNVHLPQEKQSLMLQSCCASPCSSVIKGVMMAPPLLKSFCPPVTVPETHSAGVEEEGCVRWVLLTACDEVHMKIIAPCHLAIKAAACLSSKQRAMCEVSSNGHRRPGPNPLHEPSLTSPSGAGHCCFTFPPRYSDTRLNSIKASLKHHCMLYKGLYT